MKDERISSPNYVKVIFNLNEQSSLFTQLNNLGRKY